MGRSKKECNRLFARYEGIAILAANRLWKQWGKGLAGSCLGLDDLCQESRVVLLDLCSTMDRRRGESKCRAWLVKSLRGRLFNLIRAEVYPRIQQVSVNLGNFPDKSEDFQATLPEFPLTFNMKAREFCRLVLSGDSEAQARRAVGWTKADQAKAMARLRQELEQG